MRDFKKIFILILFFGLYMNCSNVEDPFKPLSLKEKFYYKCDFESEESYDGWGVYDGNQDTISWIVGYSFHLDREPPDCGDYYVVYDDYEAVDTSAMEWLFTPTFYFKYDYLLLIKYSYSINLEEAGGDTFSVVVKLNNSVYDRKVYTHSGFGWDSFYVEVNKGDSLWVEFIYFDYKDKSGVVGVDNFEVKSIE